MRNCQECGTLIEFKGGNHRYCDICRDKTRKGNMKAALERYHEKHTHYCANCRKTLKNYKGRNHKYCPTCSENIEKENSRLRDHTYYRRWKDVLPQTLGTGWLSQHANPDPYKEQKAIKRELNRLKVKIKR